jgi:hypothetical protein
LSGVLIVLPILAIAIAYAWEEYRREMDRIRQWQINLDDPSEGRAGPLVGMPSPSVDRSSPPRQDNAAWRKAA